MVRRPRNKLDERMEVERGKMQERKYVMGDAKPGISKRRGKQIVSSKWVPA